MRKYILLTTCCLLSPSVLADIVFNGFGTIAGGLTLSDDETYKGYDSDFSMKPDSVFALQAKADLTEGLSATSQLVAKGSDEGSLEMEWAFISYELTNSTTLNMGKLRLPLYKYSDYLDVGYAYNWTKPPYSVYDMPFTAYNGISIVHNGYAGDLDYSLQAVAGTIDNDFSFLGYDIESEIGDMLGVNALLTYHDLEFRVGYFLSPDVNLNVTNVEFVGFNMLLDGLQQAYPQYAGALRESSSLLNARDDDGSFWGVGLRYTVGNLTLDAEYTSVEVKDSFFPKSDAYYLSLSYTAGDWTPFLTYDKQSDDANLSAANALPDAVIADPDGPGPLPQMPINMAVRGFLAGAANDNDTWSAGVRYNFHPAAALKVQYFTTDYDQRSADTLVASVDFIF